MDQIELGRAPEQLGGEMGRGAVAGGRKADLAWVGLGMRDELLDRTGRRGVRHHHDDGVEDHERDRGEVGDRIVAELWREEDIGGLKVTREEHGVAVGSGTGGSLGREIAAGTAAVLDCHLLAPYLGQPGRDQAADRVGAAARRERHDQTNEAGGPGLCLRERRAAEHAGRKRRPCGQFNQSAAADHGGPTPLSNSGTVAQSWTEMPACLMTGPHLSISALR